MVLITFQNSVSFEKARKWANMHSATLKDHSTSLRLKFDCIFPAYVVSPWAQNPLSLSFKINIDDAEENFQKEIFDLKASRAANMTFTARNLTNFWLPQTEVYKHLGRLALNRSLPFAIK